MKERTTQIRDTIVIYHSAEDGCWIGHSLRTDQIGTGGSVIEALADAIRAVDQVLDLAAHDKSIAAFREAPDEVKQIAKSSKALPEELYEIAHKMARGNWPAELPVAVNPSGGSFKAQVHEPMAA